MRYGRRGYPGNGPWRDVHPAQRPGRGHGYGQGYGRGYGFTGDDPTKCVRFPWMPRRWWNDPDTAPHTGSEKAFLEGQVNALTQELEGIKKRLEELPEEESQ